LFYRCCVFAYSWRGIAVSVDLLRLM